MIQRKKTNSSKANLIVSVVFHSILLGVVFYFAARGGLLGQKMKQLAVHMEKIKKPEPPKEKPPEPKTEEKKPSEAKTTVPQPKVQDIPTPPPAASGEPSVAPAATVIPSFAFSDGAVDVQSVSSPNDVYRALVEHTLRSFWQRPEDMDDDNFTAEVELSIDKYGDVEDSRWIKGSGNDRWDQTVKDAVTKLKSVNKEPPKGFPPRFAVRFDVQSMKGEAMDLGVR